MTVIDVERVRFTFGDDWVVVKWDDHAHYRQGLIRQQGTKAVDLVAIDALTAWVFEMKDFRGARIANKGRVGTELAQEVADKVRDTFASMIWAHGRDGLAEDEQVRKVLFRLLNGSGRTGPVRVGSGKAPTCSSQAMRAVSM